MRWEDERYVRVYTRDTTDWLNLTWQAQGLFCLILRKVDRAGILELGRLGARGLASHIGGGSAWTQIEPCLAELIADGCIEIHGSKLIVPRFIEAQETASSDAQRKRESRERARAMSQNVTKSHDRSQAVTSGHSVPSVPSVPYQADPPNPPSGGSALFSLSPPAKRERKRKATGITSTRPDVLEVLAELNRQRMEALPGCRPLEPVESNTALIAARLDEGNSIEACCHVVAVCAEEVRQDPKAAQWFNAVSPFRPENFARKIARQLKKTNGIAQRRDGYQVLE